MDTVYLVHGADLLDADIVEAVEAAGAGVEEAVGYRLSFKYDEPYGINVYDEGGFQKLHVMNLDLSGHYSTYDAWEYNDATWDAMEPHLLGLAAFLSEDGQPHCR